MEYIESKKYGIDELKNVIRETILEVIDPDYGLELREETISSLYFLRLRVKN